MSLYYVALRVRKRRQSSLPTDTHEIGCIALRGQAPTYYSKGETHEEIKRNGAERVFERSLDETTNHDDYIKQKEPQRESIQLFVAGMSLLECGDKSSQQAKMKGDPNSKSDDP